MSEKVTFQKSEVRKKGKTDFAALENMSEEDLKKSISEDKDVAPLLTTQWFNSARVVRPGKTPVTLRIDNDVIDYFRANGRFYQTKINIILRKYMEMESFVEPS